jgi:hypothetical protein
MNDRFTSKADIDATQTDVCFVPKADNDNHVSRNMTYRTPLWSNGGCAVLYESGSPIFCDTNGSELGAITLSA